MTRLQSIALAVAMAIIFGVVGSMDAEDAELQAKHYCDMVQLYKQTNGQQGWPAYDGECK